MPGMDRTFSDVRGHDMNNKTRPDRARQVRTRNGKVKQETRNHCKKIDDGTERNKTEHVGTRRV